MFSDTDTTVSIDSFDEVNGYTITQKAGSSGWGVGVLGDDAQTAVPWNYTYLLSVDIYVPERLCLTLDTNASWTQGEHDGNDIYGDTSFFIDNVNVSSSSTDGNGSGAKDATGECEVGFPISANTWHNGKLYMKNNAESLNAEHKSFYSYSTFGLVLTNITHDVTYYMKNFNTAIYL